MLQESAQEPLFSVADTPTKRRSQSWLESRLKRGKDELVLEVAEITPCLAELLMEHNENNRPLNSATVTRYARLMKDGYWFLTGEPIIICSQGTLLNGQHRLRACIESGEAFDAVVEFGIERKAFFHMDNGKKRTSGDAFAISGVKNYRNMAAATAWIYEYERDNTTRGGHVPAPSHEELYEFYLTLPDLQKSHKYGHDINAARLMGQAVGTALHYLFAQKNRRLANEFFDKLSSGIGLTSKTEPVAALRRRLESSRDDVEGLSGRYKAAFTIIAWNKTREGLPLKQIKWIGGDEPFPRVK